MHGMKIAAVAAACAAFCAAGAGEAVEIDGVAATVGSETILKSEVSAEMARSGLSGRDAFEKTARRLAERRLVLKAAEAAKVTMQDWVVDDRVRSVTMNSFGGDRNKLLAALAKDRLAYADWRKRIKEDLVISAMRWNEIEKSVRVSPADMRREYEEHPERYSSDRLATLAVILLRPADLGLRAEISKALEEAKTGGDAKYRETFAALARRHSADSRAKEGGVWKDVRPDVEFRPEICKAADALAVGETSQWGDLDGWAFIVRKDSEKASKRKSFAEAYEDVARNVREAETERRYGEWIKRLEKETPVKMAPAPAEPQTESAP